MRGHKILVATVSATLVGCTAPPRPATVDESKRRPANSTEAVNFQICQHELDSSRRHAVEAQRSADQLTATRLSLSVQRSMVEHYRSQHTASAAANTIYTLHFGFASSKMEVTTAMAGELLRQAREAKWVVVRGRTDGSSDAPSETKMARERANVVEAYLLAGGVQASHIRTTYQPIGDHVADNSGPEGRRMNRRVEVELYAIKPQSVLLDRDASTHRSEELTDGSRDVQ